MVIYRTNSINFLKHIALKVNENNCLYIKILINNFYRSIPALYQISTGIYRNNEPSTYHIENNVIAIVYDNENIFFIPYSPEFERILIEEKFNEDTNIYVPQIETSNLETFMERCAWKIALMFCK